MNMKIVRHGVVYNVKVKKDDFFAIRLKFARPDKKVLPRPT